MGMQKLDLAQPMKTSSSQSLVGLCQGSIDIIQYASSSGGNYMGVTDPGPSNRGENYFFGGGDNVANYGDNTITSLTQTINVSQASALISQGNIQFTLSGWLGGYSDQDDHAQLTVQFVSSTGQKLSTASIGPVLAADRNDQSGLVACSTTGQVPAATASIEVTLTMTKEEGDDNDGSADNLSLLFHL